MANGYVYDDTVGWRTIQAGDIPAGGGSPLTTKGDLYGRDAANNRVPIGADGNVLTADSAQALGLKWAAPAASGIGAIASPGGSIGVTNPTGPTTNLDLPNSGVAAATYGSSTTVPQVAINAKGIVTSASNVSISGISGTGLVKLFDSTLGAPAASIDTGAGGVSGGHVDLIIFLMLQTTQAVAGSSALLTFNGDAGAHYDYHRLDAASGAVSGGSSFAATSLVLSVLGASGGTTNYPSLALITLPAYASTTFWKVAYLQETQFDTTAANTFTGVRGMGWRSTAAINQVTVTAGSGNLVTGSRMAVYSTQ